MMLFTFQNGRFLFKYCICNFKIVLRLFLLLNLQDKNTDPIPTHLEFLFYFAQTKQN